MVYKHHILEYKKQSEINNHTQYKIFPALFSVLVYTKRQYIIGQRRKEYKDNKLPSPAHIENTAGNKQHYPSYLVRQCVIEKYHTYKEYNKRKGIKKHKITSFMLIILNFRAYFN